MTHKLDIDEPDEIIAAAGRVTTAAAAVTGRATTAIAGLVPVGAARCDLDHALLGVLHWVTTSCADATMSDSTGSSAAHHFIVRTAQALATADDHGRVAVHRSADRI
ncbi:hypothetical protein [Nocardia acidivorans]|uniref:hypothetical protein n=1 Tax=Nocardia acidivorans TaxID=404580 RepID=UPI00082F2EEB|nr:hypothetical protein [Nocardia acidivorans]